MDTSILLNGDPPAVSQHLRSSAARLGVDEVTKHLLARVENESLPPRVFKLWLRAGGDYQAIRLGLNFHNSREVRRASIMHFGNRFRTRRLKDVWEAVGGTAGIVELLSTASVYDVKHFCKQIGRSATTEVSAASRKAFVDELYQALRHMHGSVGSLVTSDRRPLSSIYHTILPACSQGLILSEAEGGSSKADGGKVAFFAHTALFRSRCIAELQNVSREVDMQKVLALVRIRSNDRASHPNSDLSGNAQFALEVLELLSTRKDIKLCDRRTLLDIADPLFRRLSRRKSRPETMVRAALAYVAFAQRHISDHIPLRDLCDGPGSFLIKDWGRRPERLSESLATLLRLAPSAHLSGPNDWLKLIEQVPKPLRLRLLSMASHSGLETAEELLNSQLQWDSKILLALPYHDARKILERLLASGSGNLYERFIGEIGLLKIKLSRYEPNLLELATTAVEQRKNEAHRAREQSNRAACVSLALRFAATSQSLDLYRETLLWTRKYIKDPLTAMEIFRGPDFSLLRGFPETRHDCASLTRDQVASNVRTANVIVSECFQSACLAQREPGFKSVHWNNVLGLMRAVVCQRYEYVNLLQDTLRLSDDDVFDTVWRNTLEVCETLENLGLDDDNSSLDFNTVGGPLMRRGVYEVASLVEARPATLRFVDTLAEKRNEVWLEYRRKHVPGTLTLSETFPHGLPLQYLLSVDLKKSKAAGMHIPYVASRAKQIVFISRETALSLQPGANEDADAIGPFVENWPHALTTYVYSSPNRQEAAIAAWKHATGPLSKSRMTAAETHLFWSSIFIDSLGENDFYGPWKYSLAQPPPPSIPTVEDAEQPTEWNPEIEARSFEVKSRRLEPMMIDAILDPHRRPELTIHSRPGLHDASQVPGHTLTPFWSRWSYPRAVLSTTREALVAAGILHISEANSLSPGILSRPFPSAAIVRFPALYLDGDFLDREDPKRLDFFAWDSLTRLSGDIPSTLLAQLTTPLIEASPNDATPTFMLKLLRLLIKCDRPQVALDLIRSMVLERPENSAWLRSILTKGLLNALPKAIVEKFLRDLSTAIQKRLSEQTTGSNDIATPRIKVTTVKMLSQLLSGAMFVDEAFASSVLIGLLAHARHIDIRVSTMESLLGIMTTSQDPAVCESILAAFSEYCIPVMASIDERSPTSLEEGTLCDFFNLPELPMPGEDRDCHPMLECVLCALGQANESVRKQLFERILIPTLFKSLQVHEIWTSLFLQSHGLSPAPLPKAPSALSLLFEFSKWPAYTPAWVLDLWRDILTAVLNPPSVIVEMNKLIPEDAKLSRSPDVHHWRSTWGTRARWQLLYGTRPASILGQDWHGGLTVEHVQNVVLHHCELVLSLCDPKMEVWTSFMIDFRPPSWSCPEKLALWHRSIRPLLQRVIDKVNARRTDEWENSPNRSPVALPDTFQLRLWLSTPRMQTEASRNADIKSFTAEVSDLLAELGSSRRSYTSRYETLKTFVLASGSARDNATLALMLGDLGGVDFDRLSTELDLKIDLVKHLLQSTIRSPPREEGLQSEVTGMVRKLTTCLDEATRMVGLALLRDRDSRGVGKAWYAGGAEIPELGQAGPH